VIPCDATVTMTQHGKGSQKEIWRVEGSNPSVSRYLCAIYYELLSSVPWCYILQALSPLVYYFYYTVMIEKGWSKILRSKKEILGIFRACCWSVLYYGKSEGQWARCLKIGRNLGQIYWSWRSWNPPPTSRAKSNKNPVKTLLSLSNGMVRLPEKRNNLNKIPERKYPYLLKLV